MHIYNLHKWKHSHSFHIDDGRGERNTRRVIYLTLVMMVIEIMAGFAFGSMALLADGWHMGTHALALGITALAYYYARRHADSPRYAFGTGKVGVLGGYTSAVVLAIVALLMALSSFKRLMIPVSIRFDEAIVVAFMGLIVNVISAFLLRHDEGGTHESGVGHSHKHDDYNLKAAYLHVLADALTSFLAIIALLCGKALGWVWMDPVMGIVGAVLILRWAYGLLRDTSAILLDRGIRQERRADIISKIESDSDSRVSDIHVWPLGSHHFAVIVSIVTHYPKPPGHYKALLGDFEELDHITVEINEVDGKPCLAV